jgi:hypothetical protein
MLCVCEKLIFCVLVMALCWQTPARASSTPPTIENIVGTYLATGKEVYYSLDECVPIKENCVLTWRIAQTSDSTVQVYLDEWDWLFTAYYKGGFLVQSTGDVRAHYGCGILMVADESFGILLAKGKPGKISLKGYTIVGFGTIDDKFGVTKLSCKYSSGS